MKRQISWILMLAMALAVSGCAQKTASEQLKDDLNKTGKQLNKDMKGLVS